MNSQAAICISRSKNIRVFYGIDTLKSGSRITSYCALINSHKYCSEAERAIVIAKFDNAIVCDPDERVFEANSIFSFKVLSANC